MSKRFDIIEHCSSECALLIDRQNKLPAVPLGFSLKMLSKEEKLSLMGWLDFLNDGKRDSVQATLVGGE